MKIKNVKQALEIFETNALQQEQCALEEGQEDQYDKHVLIINDAASWLFENDFLIQLACFYEHKSRTVRRWASLYLLAVDTQKAESMLEDLARTGDADAELVLREWKNNRPPENEESPEDHNSDAGQSPGSSSGTLFMGDRNNDFKNNYILKRREKSKEGKTTRVSTALKSGSFKPAFEDTETMERVVNHIEKHLGKIDYVFYEKAPELIRIDICWVKPSAKFPFHTLVTAGMSSLPMNAPVGSEGPYAELCILLPADWKMNEEDLSKDFEDENNYWPFRWLKALARFPHEHDAWMAWGHTIPNGRDAAPVANNTKFGCMLLFPSRCLPEDFFALEGKRKTINFFTLIPIYKEEMKFKIQYGLDELLDNLHQPGTLVDVVDIERPNTCVEEE